MAQQLNFEKLDSKRDEVLKSLDNPYYYRVIEKCEHVLLTHADDKEARGHVHRLIPIFWSNFWIEEPGSARKWANELDSVCHGTKRVDRWKKLRAMRNKSMAIGSSSFVKKEIQAADVDGSRHMGKVDLFDLALQIGGVALQVNVNMDVDTKLASLRDSFWENAPEGLIPSRKLASDPNYDNYMTELAEVQNKVGTVMSSNYAKTVLADHASSKDGNNAVVFAMKANERMGFKDGATVDSIAKELMSKFFFTAELPEILEHGSSYPLTLYVVISFVNQAEQETYEERGRRAIQIAFKQAYDEFGRRTDVTLFPITGYGVLACCVKRDWSASYPHLTALTNPDDCNRFITEDDVAERKVAQYKTTDGYKRVQSVPHAHPMRNLALAESKEYTGYEVDSKGHKGDSKGDKGDKGYKGDKADSKGGAGSRKGGQRSSRRFGPRKAEAKGKLRRRRSSTKNKRKTKRIRRSVRRRRSRRRRKN